MILLESQHGENASGNIFYLAKELCRPEYDRFTVYFVMRNKKADATEKMFRQKGMECEICDIRELVYENGRLKTPTGMEIDAIYRRAVTSDIVKH